tara:strand:+ start:87 stop:248 length:162 start_codon:yes stop_codon:yes gene_type:complete
MYKLILKTNGDTVSRISSNSLEDATYFFRNRKQMDEETFNKLYEVIEDDKERK